MRRLYTVVLVSFVVLAVPTITAGQDPAPQDPTTTVSQPQEAKAAPLRNGCGRLFTQRQFRRYASKVYYRKRISKRAGARMAQMVRCQHSPKAERKMRVLRKRYKAERRQRARQARLARSLTPYGPCYGGRWAIPCYIVGCESGGSWSAYNPSGASGPYQLLGWGAPMPANTPARRLRHHQIAAGLWNGGRGASHWVCA